MTLRATLIAWIGLVLAGSLVAGGGMVYWHAVKKIDVEMRAALEVGQHTILNAVADGAEVATPQRQLRLLVSGFDGDRHLRATLVTANGAILARSRPREPDTSMPEWFFRLIRPGPQVVRMPLPLPYGEVGSIMLEADPHNEVGEVWSDAVLTFAVLALFCCLIMALAYWSAGRVLRPLAEVIQAFDRIGAGDYGLRLTEKGPNELRKLGRAYNQMGERLADVEVRKRRLEEQLLEVQEEERGELAQDLHDEVGPLLFAMSVDLSEVERSDALLNDANLRDRVLAMRDAIGRIQRQVRSILTRLKPPTVMDLGLAHSIERLVAFWRLRYPGVEFEVSLPEDPVDAELGSSIHRIVQEGISNALRHGHPRRVEVQISRQDSNTMHVCVRDDGVGLQRKADSAGLGLAGMRERVNSLGGELRIEAGPGGRGVVLYASLPLHEENHEAADH